MGLIPELGRSPGGISLAWEIPWTEEPSGLQSMGLLKSQTQLSKNVHMHTVHDTEPPWVQARLLLAFFMYALYYQPPAPLLAITLLGPLCNLSLVALSVAYLGFMHHFNYTYGPGCLSFCAFLLCTQCYVFGCCVSPQIPAHHPKGFHRVPQCACPLLTYPSPRDQTHLVSCPHLAISQEIPLLITSRSPVENPFKIQAQKCIYQEVGHVYFPFN